MNCLWCDEEIILEINWENIFILSKPKQLCDSCEEGLEVLHGERCHKCSRMTTEKLCSDCERWSENDPLELSHSIFTYNEQMQAIVAKWKYRGDYILGNVFKNQFIESFATHFSHLEKDAVINPIPLSTERLIERGFNQAKVLADFLPLKSEDIITRIHSEKQSKKTRHERISTGNPFKVEKQINKTVILVDDIYTTGTTLRHAASLLKSNGCPKVYAYTLLRG